MKKIYYLRTVFIVCIFFSPFNLAAQQTGAYSVTDGATAGFGPTVFELDNNRIMIAGYSAFGYDSSYTKMIWLDNDMNVFRHKEFRLTLPLNYVFHTAKTPVGYLMGTLEHSSYGSPLSFVRTDTAGEVVRHDFAFDTPDFQEKIVQVVANSNGSFSGYTSKPNIASCMYRLDGNVYDTIIRAKKITPVVTNNYFRPFNTADMNGNGLHLVTGSFNHFQAADGVNGFLMKLDSSKIHWAKSYDFGSRDEAIYNVIKLADGNFAFVTQAVDTVSKFYNGFITVADTSGENIWTKKLTIPSGGVYPSALVETAGHDLLVFGMTNKYKGICMKFSATGTMLWAKELPATQGNTYFSHAIRRANNDIVAVAASGGFLVLKMDAEGNNCYFIDNTTIEAADFSPVVTNTDFVMETKKFPLSHYPVKPRNLNTSSASLCVTNSSEGIIQPESSVTVYPNPAGAVCYLNSSSPLTVSYSLSDLLGRKLIAGSFTGATALSLADLPKGIYLLHLYENNRERILKLVHQ